MESIKELLSLLGLCTESEEDKEVLREVLKKLEEKEEKKKGEM